MGRLFSEQDLAEIKKEASFRTITLDDDKVGQDDQTTKEKAGKVVQNNKIEIVEKGEVTMVEDFQMPSAQDSMTMLNQARSSRTRFGRRDFIKPEAMIEIKENIPQQED